MTDTATVIMSELLTNAVRTTGITFPDPAYVPTGGMPLVAAQARVQDSSLVLEVWGGSSKLPAPRTAGDDAEGGRGLFLVEAMSDKWGTWEAEAGGKAVYAEVGIAKPPLVSLEGHLVELPAEVLRAHLTGNGPQHLQADTALLARTVDGSARP